MTEIQQETLSILLVEDTLTQAMLMQHVLKKGGFAVKLAKSGEAALQEIATTEYKIILSDINMPGIDGYELCKQIKLQKPDIYFVLLATPVERIEIIKALASGADNFILKGYDESNFLRRVSDFVKQINLNQNKQIQKFQSKLAYADEIHNLELDSNSCLAMLISAFDMYLFEHAKHLVK